MLRSKDFARIASRAHGAGVHWDRALVIVLDGVGMGAAPDAEAYGDAGANSVSHTAERVGGLRLPNLGALGFGCILEVKGVPPVPDPQGAYGRLRPRSAGKDSITGHWELMGVHLHDPFPTYPGGFPADVMRAFERAIGRPTLGNVAASGTEIIARLGEQHLRTGAPIVYTSADSVFQVAAHESIIPVEELYRICGIARELLVGRHGVGRVIARPFHGEPGNFERTPRRRDFPRPPPEPTLLDRLVEHGLEVVTVGKIDEMFGGRGITRSHHVVTNRESVEGMLRFLDERFRGLLFVNLIEFDMIHGHRNDAEGYARALEAFDACLPEVRRRLGPGDLAIITGDHGVDPTTPGTDHTREHVPLVVFGPAMRRGAALGDRETFSDVAATLAEMFGVQPPRTGRSFLGDLEVAG